MTCRHSMRTVCLHWPLSCISKPRVFRGHKCIFRCNIKVPTARGYRQRHHVSEKQTLAGYQRARLYCAGRRADDVGGVVDLHRDAECRREFREPRRVGEAQHKLTFGVILRSDRCRAYRARPTSAVLEALATFATFQGGHRGACPRELLLERSSIVLSAFPLCVRCLASSLIYYRGCRVSCAVVRAMVEYASVVTTFSGARSDVTIDTTFSWNTRKGPALSRGSRRPSARALTRAPYRKTVVPQCFHIYCGIETTTTVTQRRSEDASGQRSIRTPVVSYTTRRCARSRDPIRASCKISVVRNLC